MEVLGTGDALGFCVAGSSSLGFWSAWLRAWQLQSCEVGAFRRIRWESRLFCVFNVGLRGFMGLASRTVGKSFRLSSQGSICWEGSHPGVRRLNRKELSWGVPSIRLGQAGWPSLVAEELEADLSLQALARFVSLGSDGFLSLGSESSASGICLLRLVFSGACVFEGSDGWKGLNTCSEMQNSRSTDHCAYPQP